MEAYSRNSKKRIDAEPAVKLIKDDLKEIG